jgi:hypothetical protein
MPERHLTEHGVLPATAPQPTELTVTNIPHALDTYLGLGYHAVSVADGWAYLTSATGAIILNCTRTARRDDHSTGL